MAIEKYDKIGANYNQTRKADPHLTDRLVKLLNIEPQKQYLDIGSGTGNYTIAVSKHGGQWIGVDPSGTMLDKAKQKTNEITWLKGNAENIPVKNNTVDAVMATLTLHHWKSIEKGLAEVKRILRPNGKIVMFTSTPKQMESYWLNHYFPKMLKDSIEQMPGYEVIEDGLKKAGFSDISTEKYFVKNNLEDLFLYAGKNRPELYLEEEVRSGISSFSHLSNINEVKEGLAELKQDIDDKKINSIITSYDNDNGDYLFISAK